MNATGPSSTVNTECYAFFKGEFVQLKDARVSVMTHALHYGTGVFEGIRGNWNKEKEVVYIYRLREHYERLLRGCKMLMLEIPYTLEDLCQITVELVERNGYKEDIYIRPLVYKSAEMVATLRLQDLPSDFTLITVPFGNYLGSNLLRCCTSSWRKIDDSMIPTRLKLCGIYLNNILAKTEATLAGFDEAIILNQDGHVCEGSGENLFMVADGQLVTPSLQDNVLPGITRDTVMQLANSELGLPVVERSIDRSELYMADELFLTGTAAHLTPVVQLDNRQIADGKAGSISTKLQDMYFDVVAGRYPKYVHWCTPAVPKEIAA
jgi:branched-chain amino acid aminotransferase